MAKAAANIEKLDLGKVIQTTVGLVNRNKASFFIASVLFSVIPAILNNIISSNNIDQNGLPKYGAQTFIVWAILVFASAILQALSALIVKDDIEGRTNQLGNSLRIVIQYSVPLVITALLSILAYFLGLFLLVIPGIMIGCAFALTLQIQIIERPAGLASFRRSRDLTRGNRWRIFFLTVVVFALIFGLTFLLLLPFGGLPAMMNIKSLGTRIMTPIASLFSGMFLGPGLAVLYFELRRINTGAASTDMGQVFD